MLITSYHLLQLVITSRRMNSQRLRSLLAHSLLGLSLVSCSGPPSSSFTTPHSSSSSPSEQSSFPFHPNPFPPLTFNNAYISFASAHNLPPARVEVGRPAPDLGRSEDSEAGLEAEEAEAGDLTDLEAELEFAASEQLTHHLLSLDLGYNILNSQLLRQTIGHGLQRSGNIGYNTCISCNLDGYPQKSLSV